MGPNHKAEDAEPARLGDAAKTPDATGGQLKAASETEPSQPQAEDRNDPEYQYNHGLAYLRGEGVPEDDEEALRWLRLAAEQGYAPAQHSLGLAYAAGVGVPWDLDEAARWFRLAAEQGHARAQDTLGDRYGNGMGVPRSLEESVRWYRRAAEQGHSDAQYKLGSA